MSVKLLHVQQLTWKKLCTIYHLETYEMWEEVKKVKTNFNKLRQMKTDEPNNLLLFQTQRELSKQIFHLEFLIAPFLHLRAARAKPRPPLILRRKKVKTKGFNLSGPHEEQGSQTPASHSSCQL